jgi:hypothetical protein
MRLLNQWLRQLFPYSRLVSMRNGRKQEVSPAFNLRASRCLSIGKCFDQRRIFPQVYKIAAHSNMFTFLKVLELSRLGIRNPKKFFFLSLIILGLTGHRGFAAPVFTSPSTASINEGVSAGTTVYTAVATEPGMHQRQCIPPLQPIPLGER